LFTYVDIEVSVVWFFWDTEITSCGTSCGFRGGF